LRNLDFYSANRLLVSFISILEESGYMSRVVFLMDKIWNFGLSGKVPLISEQPVPFQQLWQPEILKTGKSA
jgi:hypothetical protein